MENQPTTGATTTDTFCVPGMSCHHCVNAITREVSAVAGVQQVDVVLEEKTVRVVRSEQASNTAIIAAINEAGFEEITRLG